MESVRSDISVVRTSWSISNKYFLFWSTPFSDWISFCGHTAKVQLQGRILSCCTSKRLKSKLNTIVLDGMANVKRESIMYCTRFQPHLRFLVQTLHVITRTKPEDEHTDIMVLAAGFWCADTRMLWIRYQCVDQYSLCMMPWYYLLRNGRQMWVKGKSALIHNYTRPPCARPDGSNLMLLSHNVRAPAGCCALTLLSCWRPCADTARMPVQPTSTAPPAPALHGDASPALHNLRHPVVNWTLLE
jgi:hypothetical protein